MIPDKLTNFMCYDSGNKMIGVTDVSLPEIAFMTESIKGAGIAGETDIPVLGHVQAMSMTINWRSLIDKNIIYLTPKGNLFDLRGSVQMYNETTGELETVAVKVVVKCIPKKYTPGNFDVGAAMGTSSEFEVTYIKITLDGKEYLEVDKFNFIYKANGVDYLAKVRKDLGLN